MKTILAMLLWIAIAGSGAGAMVQAVPDTTTLSMRGTLARYDATTRRLALTTRSGMVTLTLVPTTRIRQGRHEIDVTTLEKLTGYRAVVRYSESTGSKILQSIHVLEKSDERQ
jgi:hypothetical protein